MGGATNITTDKTGTLTQNVMTVVKGYFGKKLHDTVDSFVDMCTGEERDKLNQHIAVNSTAFIQRKEGSPPDFVGSKVIFIHTRTTNTSFFAFVSHKYCFSFVRFSYLYFQ